MLRFITLSGFLGAGKTTTMTEAAKRLRLRGHSTAMITNDQGVRLVDFATTQGMAMTACEVTGGCFCCRFQDLAQLTIELASERNLSVVIAEAVGSCTDVTATVVRPLRQYYGDTVDVAPLTTVLDPCRYKQLTSTGRNMKEEQLAWLVEKQLEDAEIIAVNKIDLYSPRTVEEIVDGLGQNYPDARVQAYSAASGVGLDDVIDLWMSGATPLRPSTLNIDYERYGAVEALLGWLDCQLTLQPSGKEGYDVDLWAETFLREIDASCAKQQTAIGHVKLRISSECGVTSGNLTSARDVVLRERHNRPVGRAEVLINARVACMPQELTRMIDLAVATACSVTGLRAETVIATAFVPAPPKPTHRIQQWP